MHPLDQENARVIRYPARLERMPCNREALSSRSLAEIFSPSEWLTGCALHDSFQPTLSFLRNGLSVSKTQASGELRYSEKDVTGVGVAKRLEQILTKDYKGRLLRFYQDNYAVGKVPQHITLRWLLDPNRLAKFERATFSKPRRIFSCRLVREMLEACHDSIQRAGAQYRVPAHMISFWANMEE